ncbi:MAG: hypothetical protein KDB06_07395, partial [Ilumatobacter sp.]|nr:hypothetical protein [Ilumatobacter sp.]
MRTTLPNLIRGAIVALTAAAACLAAPSTTAQASTADLGYSLDALCPTMQLRVTVWNNTPNDEQLSIVLWTSLYTWTTSEITAKANQPNYVYFDVVAGERIDKIQYRDPQLNVVFNTFPGWVIDPNAPYCERKAVDHITVDNYQLSCVNGVLHATMDVINDGDYDHDMQALLAPQFDTQEQKDLAEQHGFGAAVDNFWLAAGDSHPVSLSHLVVEQFVVKVTTFTGPTHFADGPRALQGDELACQHDMSVVTGEQ